MIPTDWTGNGTWVAMATVHFSGMTAALLAGLMTVRGDRVNATVLLLLVRSSAGLGE
jgi:hypothetical protein